MNEGRIIFQVGKVGFAVNSKWKVFLDGQYAGMIDFNNDLMVDVPDGRHTVQYKVGVQATKILEINVEANDVVVECMFDGTVNNFYVVGEQTQQVQSVTKSQETVVTHEQNTQSKPVNKKIIWIVAICAVLVILALIGEKEEGAQGSKTPDFGITLDEYIDNVKAQGVSNLVYVTKGQVDDGYGYEYKHGARRIFIYTRKNGNVFKVIYSDAEFEHGTGQISELIINLAAKFLVATEVDASMSSIYTAIYDCILASGSGSTRESSDCKIGYSRTLVEYLESAWIEAK